MLFLCNLQREGIDCRQVLHFQLHGMGSDRPCQFVSFFDEIIKCDKVFPLFSQRSAQAFGYLGRRDAEGLNTMQPEHFGHQAFDVALRITGQLGPVLGTESCRKVKPR